MKDIVLARNYMMQMLTERSILEEIQSDSFLVAAFVPLLRFCQGHSMAVELSCIEGMLIGAKQLLCKYAAPLHFAASALRRLTEPQGNPKSEGLQASSGHEARKP